MKSSSARRLLPLFVVAPLFVALAKGAEPVPADPIEKIADLGTMPWKDIEAKSAGEGDLIHAEGFGPFLLIGRNKSVKESRQLWSLAEQKLVSNFAGKFDIDKPWSLSADGSYFAAWRGFIAADKIAIFDAQKGRPLAELKNPARVEGLQFLSDGRLAAYSADSMTIWDVGNKKATGTITLPKRGVLGPKPLVSPNGKVVVTVNKSVITCTDASSKELATFTCPKLDPTFATDVAGVAYHPDGKTLAVYMTAIRKQGFALLDVTSGVFKGPYEVDDPPKGFLNPNNERAIDWSRDGKALLLRNRMVADIESGKVVWQFPEPEGGIRATAPSPRLFSLSQGIYLADSGGRQVVKSITIEKDKLDTLVKAARSGAKVSEALLPKLTETTLNGVKTVTAPATPVAWSGKPDLAGEMAKVAKSAIPLDVKADQIDQIFFTPSAAGLVFLATRTSGGLPVHPLPGQPDKSKSKGVDVYRIADGVRSGRIEFAFASKFRTASLDGKFVVVSDPETGERLDVLNVEKGEPVCAFRPFLQEGNKSRRVTYVRFVAGGKLLTGNDSRYAVWNLPDCKAEAQVPMKPHVTALSPNAKLLAIAESNALRVLDASTLAVVGDLEVPEMTEIRREAKAATFHPDGKSLAVAYQVNGKDNSNGVVVAVWDLATGKGSIGASASGIFGSPFGGSSIEFAGKDHFLFNGTQLISAKRNEVVWALHSAYQARNAENTPDGRHWYTVRTDPFKEGAMLVAAEVPDPKILAWVKTIETSPNVIWKPGTTVSVNVQIPNAGMADPQKALEASLTRQGMKIGPGNTTLSVSASERATGQTVKYRDLIPNIREGLKEQSVNVVEVVGVAQLAVNGTVVWEGRATFSNAGSSIVTLPANENDVGAHLTRSMWGGVAGWASSVTPPKLLVQTRDGILALPGMATFTSKGIEVLPPVVRIGK